MNKKEIQELLDLKRWSQAELGRQLGLHESTVSCWLGGQRRPSAPACKLMRQWLEEARALTQKQPA